MADKGAELQSYNSELVLALEDLKDRQLELRDVIRSEEEERDQLNEEIRALQERLQRTEHSLAKKYDRLESYDRTISETEEAFVKILESSQTLLHVLKRERVTLNDGRAPNRATTMRSAGDDDHFAGQPQQHYIAEQTRTASAKHDNGAWPAGGSQVQVNLLSRSPR